MSGPSLAEIAAGYFALRRCLLQELAERYRSGPARTMELDALDASALATLPRDAAVVTSRSQLTSPNQRDPVKSGGRAQLVENRGLARLVGPYC